MAEDAPKVEKKPNDAPVQKDAGADQADSSSWLMKQVHQEWDALKSAVGITAKPEPKPAGDKPAGAEPADKGSYLSWLDIPNIFGDSSTDAAKVTPKGGNPESSLVAAKVTGTEASETAAKATTESRWWDSLSYAGHAVASFVEKGWDHITDGLSDTYKSIAGDASNVKTKVEAKTGADGKPVYFETRSDNSTRALSEGEQRYRDAKGGTIIKNSKTGEITSQSADGDEVYTRKADGTEVLKTKDLEYLKGKDGKYHVRDRDGNETEVSNQGAITRLNHGFKIAQRITSIDETTAKPERGQLETMTDGQRYQDRHGNIIVARENGVREVTTTEGQHFRLDRANHKVEIEENGKWRELTQAEFEKFHHCHRDRDGHGRNRFQINGVTVDGDGKVATQENVTLGKTSPDGKMTATVPTDTGKPAVVVNNPDHSSTLEVGGHITKVNPDDPKHLVEQFKENPDGTIGERQFSFDANNDSLTTPYADFGPDGTHLDWADVTIDSYGSVTSDSGSVIFEGQSSAVYASSANSEAACQRADSIASAVTAKIGSQALDTGDIAALHSCMGELNGALALAMSCGNFAAACQIMSTKGEIAGAISQASQQVALADTMRSNNMTDGDIVSAADDVSSKGVVGAAVDQEMATRGANSQTREAQLAYLSKYGTAGLTEEQIRRLTA